MRKILWGPLALLTGPQAILWAFYSFLRFVLAPDGDGATGLKVGYAIVSTLGFVACAIASISIVIDELPVYEKERKALRAKREEERAAMMRELDEQIGIPRVPRVRS